MKNAEEADHADKCGSNPLGLSDLTRAIRAIRVEKATA